MWATVDRRIGCKKQEGFSYCIVANIIFANQSREFASLYTESYWPSKTTDFKSNDGLNHIKGYIFTEAHNFPVLLFALR